MHFRCTRGAHSLGMTGCSDELGEPEFGLQLGLVDVNAVLLRIYRYSLLSTLVVTLKLCMLTILQQLSSAEAQQGVSLLLLVQCGTPAFSFVCILCILCACLVAVDARDTDDRWQRPGLLAWVLGFLDCGNGNARLCGKDKCMLWLTNHSRHFISRSKLGCLSLLAGQEV